MGWLNRLGSAITSGGQRLGHAVHQAGDAAVRLIDHVAPVVERAAGKVANVAGTIAKGAAMAIPFVQEVPVVGAVVDAVAAGAKAVQGAALGVRKGAQFAEKSTKAVRSIERKMAGQVADVTKMGTDFVANPNLHDAKRYGGEIASMVRHNRDNIKEAQNKFNKIRGRGP